MNKTSTVGWSLAGPEKPTPHLGDGGPASQPHSYPSGWPQVLAPLTFVPTLQVQAVKMSANVAGFVRSEHH